MVHWYKLNYTNPNIQGQGHLTVSEAEGLLDMINVPYHKKQLIGSTFKNQPIYVYSLTTDKLQ